MRNFLVFLVFSVNLCTTVVAAPLPFEQWEFSGFLKSLNLHYQGPPKTAAEDGWFSSNRLRLTLLAPLSSTVEMEIAAEHQLLWTDPSGQIGLAGPLASRGIDLEHNWNEGGSASGQLQLDRLNLQRQKGDWRWRMGRQAIGFGRIGLYSPLDIVTPFPPDSLDTEVRPGIDALRITTYRGMAGQYDLIGVWGQTSRQHSLLATVSENWQEVDLLAIGGRLLDRWVIGAGLAGELGGAGLKTEWTYVAGKKGDPHDDFVIGAIESNMQLGRNLTLSFEYLYNGAGTRHTADYPLIATSTFYQEGLGYLRGQHYLITGASWQAHPLVTFNGLGLFNLNDSSALVRPTVQVSLGDNTVVQLFYTLNVGVSPQNSLTPRSEFGSAGNSGGLFFKHFF